MFVQWSRIGGTSPSGHLETDFLAEADTEADARAIVGALSLGQVRGALQLDDELSSETEVSKLAAGVTVTVARCPTGIDSEYTRSGPPFALAQLVPGPK